LELDQFAAEQQILMAFNYRDLGQVDKATQYCSAVDESYKNMDNQVMIEQAQILLDELNTSQNNILGILPLAYWACWAMNGQKSAVHCLCVRNFPTNWLDLSDTAHKSIPVLSFCN